MNGKHVLLAVVLMSAFGCASTPIATDLSAVIDNPEQFRNKRIEITGPVLENFPPQGDEYRTWTCVVGSPGPYRVTASEDGFNPSTIERAYRLVEEARQAGEEVTITGKLRVGPYRQIEAGMEIELDSVLYGGTKINTDKGPFVRNYYYYYPYYYHGPVFLHYGYYHHHYW